jgi:hypothetical protein
MYGSEECSRLLTDAGLHVERVDRYKVSWLWGMMTATARKHGAS